VGSPLSNSGRTTAWRAVLVEGKSPPSQIEFWRGTTSVEAVNTRVFFGPDPGGSTEKGLWCIETPGLSHARPLMSLLSVRILQLLY
jgi:hypothetical protein